MKTIITAVIALSATSATADICDNPTAVEDGPYKGLTNQEIISEINDVVTLLGLIGIPVFNGETVVPDSETLVKAQNDLIEIYDVVVKDKNKLSDFVLQIAEMFSWIKSDVVQDNIDREARAKKSAEKYGSSSEASYIIQLAEETLEVIEANDPAADAKALEIKKRDLKVIRFGADTVIKQDGPHKGLTNQEALDKAKAALK